MLHMNIALRCEVRIKRDEKPRLSELIGWSFVQHDRHSGDILDNGLPVNIIYTFL